MGKEKQKDLVRKGIWNFLGTKENGIIQIRYDRNTNEQIQQN